MKDRKKVLLIVLFAGILGIAAWLIISSQLPVSNEQFGIYLLENDELLISDEDVISYNRTSHEIRINQNRIDVIKTLDLVRKPFVIKINGVAIYDGIFWSDIFSSIHSGIVMTDILAIQNGSTDTMRIELCYPPQFCDGIDPRNNAEIISHFQRAGKLIE